MPLRRMQPTHNPLVPGVKDVDRPVGRPRGSGGRPLKRDVDMSTLGGRIRHARLEQQMTVEALARLMHFDRTNLCRLELGRYNKPAFRTIMLAAIALDVSLDYLAGFQEEYGSCPKSDL